MTFLMLSLNNSRAAFQFISNAEEKVSRAMIQANLLFKLKVIDDETKEFILNLLEASKALLEQILS